MTDEPAVPAHAAATTGPGRVFAVVPAAGQSRRMGQPKLLLKLGGRSIIRRLLDALQAGGVTAAYVLVRKSDHDLQDELSGTQARVVLTDETPDMRASVEKLVVEIARREAPISADGWLLSPADHPLLEPAATAALLAARRPGETEILVPVYERRRGHPTYFSWNLAGQVASIPDGQGVNLLLHRYAGSLRELPVDSSAILLDLDTPDDLKRVQQQMDAAR